jgi:hypothetical protein
MVLMLSSSCRSKNQAQFEDFNSHTFCFFFDERCCCFDADETSVLVLLAGQARDVQHAAASTNIQLSVCSACVFITQDWCCEESSDSNGSSTRCT